jgi:hypothetical protein
MAISFREWHTRRQPIPTERAGRCDLGFAPEEFYDRPHPFEEPAMHTNPPIDPDDPSGPSGDDVREPPLPGATQRIPREEFPRKGDVVDPEPSHTKK